MIVSMKERIHYIDVAKGILIILVILHHFPQLLMEQYGVSNSFLKFLDSASDYYNAFFMPAFFIITGYCTNFSKLPLSRFFVHQINTIMIPAFCLGAVSVWISLIGKGCTEPVEYCKIGFSTFIKSGGPFWFLTALFWSKLFYKLWICLLQNKENVSRKCFHITTSFFCLSLFIIGCLLKNNVIPNIWWFIHALLLTTFLYVGQILRLYHVRKISVIISLLYLLTIVLLNLNNISHPYITAGINADIIDFPLLLSLAISGSMLIFHISQHINNNSIIEFFGKNSLIIYCLHISTMSLVFKQGGKLIGIPLMESSLASIIVLLISLLVILLFVWLLNKKYFRFFQGKFKY